MALGCSFAFGNLQCNQLNFNRAGLVTLWIVNWACADPEGGTGGPDPPPPTPLPHPEKSQNLGFSSNTGPDTLKNHIIIQCWAFIGMPAKCHLMAFSWQADDGPLIVVPLFN